MLDFFDFACDLFRVFDAFEISVLFDFVCDVFQVFKVFEMSNPLRFRMRPIQNFGKFPDVQTSSILRATYFGFSKLLRFSCCTILTRKQGISCFFCTSGFHRWLSNAGSPIGPQQNGTLYIPTFVSDRFRALLTPSRPG